MKISSFNKYNKIIFNNYNVHILLIITIILYSVFIVLGNYYQNIDNHFYNSRNNLLKINLNKEISSKLYSNINNLSYNLYFSNNNECVLECEDLNKVIFFLDNEQIKYNKVNKIDYYVYNKEINIVRFIIIMFLIITILIFFFLNKYFLMYIIKITKNMNRQERVHFIIQEYLFLIFLSSIFVFCLITFINSVFEMLNINKMVLGYKLLLFIISINILIDLIVINLKGESV